MRHILDPEFRPLRSRVPWTFWLFALVVVACAFAVATVRPAPIPKAKELPRKLAESLVGKFTLYWGGSPYACEIGRDGSWECRGGATTWIGVVEVRGDRVTLTEATWDATTGQSGAEHSYEIILDAMLAGEVVGGCSVRFERKGPDI